MTIATATTTATRPAPLSEALPNAFKGLLAQAMAVKAAAEAAGLTPIIGDLVHIRASQINGCAHCLRMHVNEAIAHGDSAGRLALVSVWRDTAYFTPVEQAALRIAEDITLIADPLTRTTTNREAYAPLTEAQIAVIQWDAMVINSFNRLAISSDPVVAP